MLKEQQERYLLKWKRDQEKLQQESLDTGKQINSQAEADLAKKLAALELREERLRQRALQQEQAEKKARALLKQEKKKQLELLREQQA